MGEYASAAPAAASHTASRCRLLALWKGGRGSPACSCGRVGGAPRRDELALTQPDVELKSSASVWEVGRSKHVLQGFQGIRVLLVSL